MKRYILLLLLIVATCGCSIVRIDTSDIDNILNVILTKDNKLYNQVGQGYKYYLPGGVTYIDSDEANDILYCNGNYYYLYVDSISYYYNIDMNYTENKNMFYSKKILKNSSFKHSGYLQIDKKDDLYYIDFVYNFAKIEAIVDENDLNDTILNASYILSTIRYNKNIVNVMMEDDYFTNKTGKFNDYNTKSNSEKFILHKDEMTKEG
ncbi:MAG: hypothetical protein Q4E75_04195 [bacterium]|nr:hypothetical protein [bacterium]